MDIQSALITAVKCLIRVFFGYKPDWIKYFDMSTGLGSDRITERKFWTGIRFQKSPICSTLPGTQRYKWTKPDALHFKWKNDHSRTTRLAAKYTLFFVFPIESAQHVLLFYGLGHKMTVFFRLEAVIGSDRISRLGLRLETRLETHFCESRSRRFQVSSRSRRFQFSRL